MISSYKDKSDQHMECEEDNDENVTVNHQWLNYSMELYKSQQNMEVYKTRWNDCQEDVKKTKKSYKLKNLIILTVNILKILVFGTKMRMHTTAKREENQT